MLITLLILTVVAAFCALVVVHTHKDIRRLCLEYVSLLREVFSPQSKEELQLDFKRGYFLIREGLISISRGLAAIGAWVYIPCLLIILLLILPFKVLLLAYMPQ